MKDTDTQKIQTAVVDMLNARKVNVDIRAELTTRIEQAHRQFTHVEDMQDMYCRGVIEGIDMALTCLRELL